MSRCIALVAVTWTVTISGISLGADSQTSAPSTSPSAAVETMKIVVAEVKGLVQVRPSENAPWQAAKEGMVLTQGAEFRTGPRSSVTCQIPPDQTLTLDRLGTVKIDEAIKSGNKIKTDMVMKYGRTRYDIEAAGAEHESTIRSPSSTLAVRGTEVSLYDQPPFVPEADSFHGRATFRNAQRELRFGDKTFTQVSNDKSSAAETALAKQTVDPRFAAARTASEAAYIANETSRGATFSLDNPTMIPIVRNGPGPLTDAQLARPGALPGSLDLVLRWTGNANLNILADDIPGQGFQSLIHFPSEILYPAYGLNVSKSGGIIPYDDRGGKNGGMELAYWNSFPAGVYGIGALFISGKPADYEINAYLNGKPLQLITGTDDNGNPITTTTLSGTLSSPKDSGPTGVILFAPPQASTSDSVKKASSGKSADHSSLKNKPSAAPAYSPGSGSRGAGLANTVQHSGR